MKEEKYICPPQGIRWEYVSIYLHGMVIFTCYLKKRCGGCISWGLSFEIEIFGKEKLVGPQEELFMIRPKYFLGGTLSGWDDYKFLL